MENKKSAFAVVQTGLGIVCLLIGIIIFLSFEVNYVLGATLLFLGTGILLHGVTNNNTDKSEKGKRLSLIATICVVIASGLIFYNFFFNSK
jgi:membrane-bound ClpP family serine protease